MANDTLIVFLKWIHLIVTVAWIGGMFTNFFIYIPAIGKTLDPPVAGKLMGAVMKRFRVMVYLSMALFLITGILLGYLELGSGEPYSLMNHWVALLIFKIPLFVVMLILAVVAFEVVAPKVARIAAEGPSPKLRKAQKTQMNMALAGFILGLVILLISAAL
jgi:uncharacterized membrane protein